MRRIKKRGRRFSMPEIALMPLIDMALTLLVIFMVAAPILQRGIRVDLPKGDTKEAQGKQELVVTITRDEKLFFNSYPLERKDLTATIKREMGGKDDLPVYIRADEKITYGRVIEIVDELKQSGIRFVAMSTRAVN
ncbi:biopolymer transporter ExbD [Candidatus Babeliales bacterium]|nr:biopolymer transporter ExbD [Candidatus Babeliales bacterium]